MLITLIGVTTLGLPFLLWYVVPEEKRRSPSRHKGLFVLTSPVRRREVSGYWRDHNQLVVPHYVHADVVIVEQRLEEGGLALVLSDGQEILLKDYWTRLPPEMISFSERAA